MPQNLLDTHTFIWFVEGSKELSALARKSVEANDTTNYISIASLWEIAIKISLHKLQLTTAFYQLNTVIANNGFEVLSITFEDTLTISALPFFHRYPFDRIIIAQAIINKLTLLSRDTYFSSYPVKTLW